MKEDIDTRMKHYEFEAVRRWQERIPEIPFLVFPPDWQVQIIPPFGGLDARFRVRKGKACVSIYLDWYETAGCWGGPYWEVYPHDEDVFRCDMDQTEALMGAIGESIAQQMEDQ